jgi:hypothetical protein
VRADSKPQNDKSLICCLCSTLPCDQAAAAGCVATKGRGVPTTNRWCSCAGHAAGLLLMLPLLKAQQHGNLPCCGRNQLQQDLFWVQAEAQANSGCPGRSSCSSQGAAGRLAPAPLNNVPPLSAARLNRHPHMQGEAAAVLWLDVASESVFLTERCVVRCQKPNHRLGFSSCAQTLPSCRPTGQPQITGEHTQRLYLMRRWDPDDPVSRPVPLNVCVARQEAVCHAGQQVQQQGPPSAPSSSEQMALNSRTEAAARAVSVTSRQGRWPAAAGILRARGLHFLRPTGAHCCLARVCCRRLLLQH